MAEPAHEPERRGEPIDETLETLRAVRAGDVDAQAFDASDLELLDEALQTLRAIRSGELDALILGGAGVEILDERSADTPYRLFFDAMVTGALSVTTEGTILLGNDRIGAMIGVPSESLVGKSVIDLVSVESQPRLRDLLASGRPTPMPVEMTLVTESGAEVAVRVSAGPIDLVDRVAVALVIADVSEIRDALETQRFQAGLLDAVGEAVIATDTRGTVLYANAEAERLYGWGRGELAGRSILETTPTDASAEQAADIMASLTAGSSWTGEFSVRRRDGATFSAHVVDTPVFDDAGDLFAIIGISSDITERKRAEAALAVSERRFKAMVGNSGSLFAVADADRAVSFLDGPVEETFGVAPEALIGTDLYSFVLPEDRARADRSWARRVAIADPMPYEDYWIKRADGAWICLSVLATNLLDDPDVRGVVATARDVTGAKQLAEARQVLSGTNAALVRAVDEAQLYREICDVVVGGRTYELAWVGLRDPDAPLGVRMVAFAGESVDYIDMLEQTYSDAGYDGPLVQALATHEVQIVQDVSSGPDAPWRRLASEHGLRSTIALPLSIEHGLIGVLCIYSDEPGVFGAEALAVLSELASDLARGIAGLRNREQRDAYRARFDQSLESAVRAVAAAAELRDPYTAGHQRRVAELSVAIATAMGLDPDAIAGLGVAASIHDIGKLAIPAEILTRPGRLSEAEFGLIKGHPRAGYDIIAGIEFPWPVADMILQHHERLDGSGYPAGLRGDEIIVGARIMAVADTVEAMQNHRPYRPAIGIDAALEAIDADRGTRLEPAAVDACLHLFREAGFAFTP